jgi:hypothetical protein
MCNPSRKNLLVVALVCLCSLLSASSILADTQTGNQNPDLTVTVTLASSGKDPQRATVGDTVTATWTVVNDTTKDLRVKVTLLLAPPNYGVRPVTRIVTIPAKAAWTTSAATVITSSMSKGVFLANVRATDDFGQGYKSYSYATATVTVY